MMTTPATTPADGELILKLQRALAYWMPSIAGEDSIYGEKAAEHAMLLYGLSDTIIDCAGDRIWKYVGDANKANERLLAAIAEIGCPEDCEDAAEWLVTTFGNRRATPSPEKAPEPVAWFEAEETTRGADLRDIINSVVHSTRWHWQAERPKTNNPVWPVYASPGKAEAERWQPIETAPKDGTMVILGRAAIEDCEAISVPGFWQEGWEDSVDDMGCDSGFVDVNFQQFSGGRSFGADAYRCAPNQPTHWMPLPPTPQERDKQ